MDLSYRLFESDDTFSETTVPFPALNFASFPPPMVRPVFYPRQRYLIIAIVED
jgi:hypothetical protein